MPAKVEVGQFSAYNSWRGRVQEAWKIDMPEGIKPPLPTDTLVSARRLRSELTDAERKLWARLRGRQIQNFKFRRQHPIPPFVADFCCLERRLIVELDGSQHSDSVDAGRTALFEQQGWQVVRFWNNDVVWRIDAVLEAIVHILSSPYPHPNPSPGGRGAIERKR